MVWIQPDRREIFDLLAWNRAISPINGDDENKNKNRRIAIKLSLVNVNFSKNYDLIPDITAAINLHAFTTSETKQNNLFSIKFILNGIESGNLIKQSSSNGPVIRSYRGLLEWL